MSRIGARVRALLLCALLVASCMNGNAAVAQRDDDVDPEFFESELSGIEVEVTGNFAIYQAELQEYRHGQGEIVSIGSDTAYVQVSFFDDTDTSQETLEIYNDSFESEVDEFVVLDEGDRRDTVFTFAVAELEGVEFYYYLSVTEDVEENVDVLQRVFATDATFFDDLADAQESITIDRDGFLENVDVADLEDIADGAVEQRGDDPTEEPAETEEPTEEPVETGEPVEAVPTIDPATATVYDMEIVPGQIVATSDVQVFPASVVPPGVEEIPFRLGDAEGTIVLLLRPMHPEQTLEQLLQIFTPEGATRENIGTDADRTSAWSLDILEVDGEQTLFYVHVQNDRFSRYHYSEVVFAPIGELEGSLDAFGDNVQIDGIPMFAEAERETIAFLLEGGETANQQTGGREESGTEEKNDQGEEATEESGGTDLESQGLIASNEYESPQYGIGIEWDDTVWDADPAFEQTAVSDTDAGIDTLVLFWLNGDAAMFFLVMPSDSDEPADFVDLWQSDEYILDQVHEDAEVLLADSSRNSGGVVYRSYNAEGQEMIVVNEAIYIDDETIVLLTMYGSPADIAGAYGDAEDLISVDGNDATGTFTSREIDRALDE